MHSTLDQFLIRNLFNIELFGYNVSITNSAMFMVFSVFAILLYFLIAFSSKKLIPGRFQVSAEFVFNFIHDLLEDNIGEKGRRFMPLIFSLFMFILICNLFGMVPYGFTVTSHISITFTMAIILFIFITCLGFYLHGMHFLSLFVPKGLPLILLPLMFVIELFAYLVRPVSLSIRLSANMVAGHVLLKVMAGFVVSLALYWKFFPAAFILVLIGFEIFVAVLQAYIFTILSCIYINDVINLH